MGITHYAWGLDPLGRPYGGGSVQVRPRDFLKFGQLMLNGGTWAGRRVLDPAFAAAATSPHYHLRNNAYGYLWWVEDLPYKNRTVRAFSMRGAGGNWVLVAPELDLVVAIMAGNYSSRVQGTYTANLIPRSILPAVREPGDNPNAPVSDRDFTSPYGRSTDGSRVPETR
jgi:CubicO group peptidase (beta-lactamase class C family)